MPIGLASYLPDEPTTFHEAKVSPEWPQWRGLLKREMDGQGARGMRKVVDRPKRKTVIGSKTVFERKVGQDGRVEKYKCRFVAQGFRQIKGIHYPRAIVADTYVVEHPNGAGGDGPVRLRGAAG